MYIDIIKTNLFCTKCFKATNKSTNIEMKCGRYRISRLHSNYNDCGFKKIG